MPLLLEHTRAGSDGDFLIPVIGTAWTKTGTPTYEAAKWGNGVRTKVGYGQDSWSKLISNGSNILSITCSIKVDNDQSTNIGVFYDTIGGYSDFFMSGGKLYVYITTPTSTPYGVFGYVFDLPTWSAGDILDFCFLIDCTAGAGLKCKCYVNGVLRTTTTYNASYDGDFGTSGFNLAILTDPGAASVVVDNFKVWNKILTLSEILQARHNERAGLADQVLG